MKIFLCQTSSTIYSKVPVIPYAQMALAAHIEDIADVRIGGYGEDGTYPRAHVILEKIKKFNPDVVGITVEYAVAYSASLDLAKKIKEYNPEIIVIAGGHHATFSAEKLLSTGLVDAIFTGEGEVSLREFILKQDFRKASGVIYMENGEFVRNQPSPLIDLNELKPPAYHLLPNKGQRPLMGIESSRGCSFNCNFCETRNFFGSGKIRRMSPEHFVENLNKVVEVTGGGNFVMLDDNFTADMRGHVKPICEALIAKNLPISIFFQGRVDDLVRNVDLLPLLSKAKIKSVLLGIEAIYDETLNLMNKKAKYNKETIKNLVAACHDSGIAVFAAIVFGYPNETPEMISYTSDYLISLGVDTASMTIATPIPGSALYASAVENKQLLSTDFDYYGGMDRVLSTIPETTPEAAANARRKFFIRPDYIRKILNNSLDPNKADITGFMPAGLLCHNLCMPMQSRPRFTEEWLKMFEGIILFLQDHLSEKKSDYSADVEFKFGSEAIVITVKDGVPVLVKASDNKADVSIESDIETLVDLFIWSPLDITSAFILGKVKSDTGFDELAEFITWFSDTQQFLRWAITMKMNTPVLKYWFMTWLGQDLRRKEKFSKVMKSELTLFMGTENAGLVIEFSKEKGFKNISFVMNYQAKENYIWTIEDNELSRIVNGGFEQLGNVFDRLELIENTNLKKELKTPVEFFSTLQLKFQPDKAANADLRIQFIIDFGSGHEESWWMEINYGTLKVEEGTMPSAPTATIRIPDSNFLKMVNGKATPYELYMNGGMTLVGLPQTMIQMAASFKNLFNTDV